MSFKRTNRKHKSFCQVWFLRIYRARGLYWFELKSTDEDVHTLLSNSINRNCWLLSSVPMATPEWSRLGIGSSGNQFGCIYLVADITWSGIWACVRFLRGCLYCHCNCLALFCRRHPTINLGCCRRNSNPDWGSDHRLSTTLINFCLSIVESGLVSAGLQNWGNAKFDFSVCTVLSISSGH